MSQWTEVLERTVDSSQFGIGKFVKMRKQMEGWSELESRIKQVPDFSKVSSAKTLLSAYRVLMQSISDVKKSDDVQFDYAEVARKLSESKGIEALLNASDNCAVFNGMADWIDNRLIKNRLFSDFCDQLAGLRQYLKDWGLPFSEGGNSSSLAYAVWADEVLCHEHELTLGDAVRKVQADKMARGLALNDEKTREILRWYLEKIRVKFRKDLEIKEEDVPCGVCGRPIASGRMCQHCQRAGEALDAAKAAIARNGFEEAEKRARDVLEIWEDNPEALDVIREVESRREAERRRRAEEEVARQERAAAERSCFARFEDAISRQSEKDAEAILAELRALRSDRVGECEAKLEKLRHELAEAREQQMLMSLSAPTEVAIERVAGKCGLHLNWKTVRNATEYIIARTDGTGRKDEFHAEKSEYSDFKIEPGILYSYRVISCRHGQKGPNAVSVEVSGVWIEPIRHFTAVAVGIGKDGVCHLKWSAPDIQRKFRLMLVRDGSRQHEVTGLTSFDDDGVSVGQDLHYELILEVAGQRTSTCTSCTVRPLGPLSPVENLQVFRARGGMVQLTWEWPEDVDEVELGAAGGDPSAFRRLTKIDYDQRGAFLSLTHDVQTVVVRSVRRFGTKVHSGPEVSAPIPESRGCVHWRICQQQTRSFFDRLRHRQYGVSVERGNSNGEIALTVVNLTYDNATFEVMIPADRREVFAPFPKEFARGDKIAVKVPTGFGVVCDSFSTIP